jgi:hypothetical protein
MIFLSNIFEMTLMAQWQSPHIHKLLKVQSVVPGGVLIRPNAFASFSL